ncbi:mevalonate kinase family protein [Aquimarina brevivitae]|uniref:Mevalonate kinase n=1 Tax=Aquimarina brevivitae TaxID=323412 RepID=A0A4Q7PHU8_9FLAO|nr:mevalonate kinase [Aquimarina brevivitae]RZS99757.1 mevalonate kinase [Aquimarina brevivitae]
MKGPLFYSKILLFGEYGIIKDSKGLSIPYNFYKGALKVSDNPDDKAIKSNKSLANFANYLATIEDKGVVNFDLDQLQKDIDKGMYFDSSIPQGYGVGSSGALVAAIYDNYAKDKITVLENLTRDKLLKLKEIFGLMESFFHGNSSGLDPLNSYLSLPILIHSKDDIEPAGIPSQSTEQNKKGAVFLLDSGVVGETAPMVSIFMENMKQEGFRNMLKNQFVKHTDACVDDFLKGDIKSLFSNIKQLSNVVFDNFKPMIPKQFHKLWKQGIETNDYYLKLCGSGGGGYILGFTQDYAKAQEALKDYKLEVVYNF